MRNLKSYINFLNEDSFNIKNEEPNKIVTKLGNIFKKYKNVREVPRGSKKGPEVSKWLEVSGAKPGNNWCMAFVYGVFNELADSLGITNPLPKTAGVINHWDKTDPDLRLNISEVKDNMELLLPGMIFIMHRAKSKDDKNVGHAGIILQVDPIKKTFISIEGNTKDMGSGESGRVGVNSRKISDPLLIGFTDYFKDIRTPDFNKELTQSITEIFKDDIERIKFKNPAEH